MTRKVTKIKMGGKLTGELAKLRAASFSALQEYENGCPRRVYYGRVERRPDPLGKAAQRGNRVHDEAYKHLVHEAPLPRELEGMLKHLEVLKSGKYILECEGDWAVDRTWSPTEWMADDVYVRCKTDVLALAGNKTRTIDFKTGQERPYHVDQLELQGLFVLIRNDHIDVVQCELWYVDQREIAEFKVRRREMDALKEKFDERFGKLLAEERWPERPGQSCKYCAFSRAKGGPCKY